jgi:hypothetical protein
LHPHHPAYPYGPALPGIPGMPPPSHHSMLPPGKCVMQASIEIFFIIKN